MEKQEKAKRETEPTPKDLGLPISIKPSEDNSSIWNRLKTLYIPDRNEKNIVHREQTFHRLCLKCTKSEKPIITKRSSFYSSLLSDYPNISKGTLMKTPVSKDNPSPKFTSPNEEIDFLDEVILQLKQKTSKLLSESTESISPQQTPQSTKGELITEINNAITVKSIRAKNLSDQIYTYQMRLIANGISLIQKSSSYQFFLLSFDQYLHLPQLCLKLSDYKELIKHRDSIMIQSRQEQEKSTIEVNDKSVSDVTISTYDSVPFVFCHHCKLRKKEGKYCSFESRNTLFKQISINNLSLFIQDAHIYVINYLHNTFLLKMITNYLIHKAKTQEKVKCLNFICSACIRVYLRKDAYDPEMNLICPKCSALCNCISCQGENDLIKLVASYLSLQWDMNYLLDYCINRYPLLKAYMNELFLSKFILCSCTEDLMNYKFSKKTFEQAKQDLSNIIRYQKVIGEDFLHINSNAMQLIQKKKRLKQKINAIKKHESTENKQI